MKKLIQLFLCSTVLFSMFGCSKPKIDEQAIDRIIPAVQKFAEVDSFDYELGFEAPLTNGKLYGSCILDELQLSLFLDLTSNGMKSEKFAEVYIVDQTAYMNALGQKQKQKLEWGNMPSFSFDPETVGFDKEMFKENLKAASIEGETLHFELKDEIVQDASVKGDINFKEIGIDEVNNMIIDVELANDFFKSLTLTFEGLSNGEKVTVSAYLKLDSINEKKTLEFPKDLDTWPLAKSNNSGN